MTLFLNSSLKQLQALTRATYNSQTAPVASALWSKHLQPDNPLWGYVTAKPFSAKTGSGSAHVMAITDKRLPGLGLVGYFACSNSDIGAEVLQRASLWLHDQKGLKDIYGPINGTATSDYRLNLDDDYWFPGEPVNPLFHVEAFTKAGFSEFNRYVSGITNHYQLFSKLFVRLPKNQANIRLRAFDTENQIRDLMTFHDLMVNIFPSQSVYCPELSWEERLYNMKSKNPMLNPLFTYFLELDEKPIGVIVAYPYMNKLVVKTIGILPQYRGQHLSGLLINKVHKMAAEEGLEAAIYAMIRQGNPVHKMKHPGVKIARRYMTMKKSF